MPRRSTGVALAALAAIALLGGCGDDLEEFRDDLRPLEERAEEQRSVISGQLRSLRLGSGSDARGLRAQTAELGETYDEIAALEPPDDYAEPFRTYVRSNERMVQNLERFAAELGSGDLAGLRRASRQVVRDLSSSQTARLHWLE